MFAQKRRFATNFTTDISFLSQEAVGWTAIKKVGTHWQGLFPLSSMAFYHCRSGDAQGED